MRLMSLAGLASKGSGEISYSVVRDTLKVDFIFQCYRLLGMLHVAFLLRTGNGTVEIVAVFP